MRLVKFPRGTALFLMNSPGNGPLAGAPPMPHIDIQDFQVVISQGYHCLFYFLRESPRLISPLFDLSLTPPRRDAES